MSNCKIDWLSITLPYSSIVQISAETLKPEIRSGIRDEFPSLSDWIMSYPDLTSGGGNRIFDRSIRSKLGGFHVFWKSNVRFSLIEIEGAGVQQLREQKLLKRIIRQYSNRLTRLDVAIDWDTTVSPRDFSDSRDKTRFVSHAEITSETGETCYVGSKSSDRFARTYRYTEPHPRAGLLRCEFQLRKDNAKLFAELLQSNSLSTLVGKLLQTFGYTHPLTQQLRSTERLLSAPRSTSMGSTERWLFSQVLPACKKMIDNGQGEYVDIFGKQLYAYFQDRAVKEDNARQIMEGN